jgi:hypothetical protein
MATKKKKFCFGSFSINDGSQIGFGRVNGLVICPSAHPALYNIMCHKSDTIATIMATSPRDVTFI